MVLVAVGFTLAAFSGSASAQGVDDGFSPDPDVIWDAQTEDPNAIHTEDLRALVFDFEELNGVVYAGGQFLEMRSTTGAVVSKPYLVALDMTTGALINSFSPSLDGPVYTITTAGDGALIIGGEFTGGVAKINATTGARDASFKPSLTKDWGRPAVWDIEVVGSKLYVGGVFNRIGPTVQQNLARINYPSGTLDTGWVATTQGVVDGSNRSGNPKVWNLAVDASRGRVYLAGKFDRVNNVVGTDNFAVISTANGSVLTGLPQGNPVGALNHDGCSDGTWNCWHFDNSFYDVQFDGNVVYLGGEAHQTIRLNASDLTVTNYTFSNRGLGDVATGGDTQVILVGKDRIWSGCHCWGSVEVYPGTGVMNYGDLYIAFANQFANEAHQKTRATFSQNRWNAQLRPQVFNLKGQSGTWAILEDSRGRLWNGGQFTEGGNGNGGWRTLTAIARFTPTTPAVAPASCAVSSVNGAMAVTWVPGANSNAFAFKVYRSTGGAFSLRAQTGVTTNWNDTSVAYNSLYSYRVETVTGHGPTATTTCSPTAVRYGSHLECGGRAVTIIGTDGDDTIVGTAGVDVIRGLGGNDTISGLGGNDYICGDSGNDVINGGGGNDRIIGNDGNDQLLGEAGRDVIYGGAGWDTLRGGFGSDTLYGGNGNDKLYGDQGFDVLRGGSQDDLLEGGNGQDDLYGMLGNDTLKGQANKDFLSGGSGDDKLFGGGGPDTLSGGPGNDISHGGDGTDTCASVGTTGAYSCER
jgi:Ca2+-binding RTX toxin-like protein